MPQHHLQQTLHIHISNISEDVWEFINTLPKEKKQFEIRENAELSDRDLFCFLKKEHVIVIMPKSIDTDFLAYFEKLFPRQHLEVLWPESHSGLLSTDILNDKKLMKHLQSVIQKYERVELTCYSTTTQFLELTKRIQSKNVFLTESPSETWMIEYFGTKAGFRQNQYSHTGKKQFPMCEGVSIMGVTTASEAASHLYQQKAGVVVKTNKGHAGMGVLIFKKGDLDEKKALAPQIAVRMTEEYWEKFPIVVEEFIPCNPKIGGGFPNAECFVKRDGTVQYLYTCGMRVNPSGEFKGVEIGMGAMKQSDEKKMETYGKNLGKLYANANYIGYFDVDCLAGVDNTIYVSESNVRRTGGTHVFLTEIDLFGKKFAAKTYALSNNLYQIADKKSRSFQKLQVSLASILFDPKTKEGVLIVAANLLHRAVFGYIIFGNNKKRAYAIEEKMEKLLES